MNKQGIIAAVRDIIVKAGMIAIDCRKTNLVVTYKTDSSPVTNADKEVSNFIAHSLKVIAPGVPLICEERDIPDVENTDRYWLVDPIDGTKSFINNKDSFTVNIALIEQNRPTIGFIYEPARSRLYYTNDKNELVIEQNGNQVPPNPHDKNGLVAVISSNHSNRQTKEYLDKYEFEGVLSIPSSIKLCMIAEGIADIYPKFSDTMEWDIAAGDAIIRASGGRIISITGGDLQYGKTDLLNQHFLAMGRRWIEKQFII